MKIYQFPSCLKWTKTACFLPIRKAIGLPFRPNMVTFHYPSILTMRLSLPKIEQISPESKAICLPFWPKMPCFYHPSISSPAWSLPKASESEQKSKAIVLLFGKKSPLFIILKIKHTRVFAKYPANFAKK